MCVFVCVITEIDHFTEHRVHKVGIRFPKRLNGRQIDYSCGFGIKYDLKMILRMLLKIFGEKSDFI